MKFHGHEVVMAIKAIADFCNLQGGQLSVQSVANLTLAIAMGEPCEVLVNAITFRRILAWGPGNQLISIVDELGQPKPELVDELNQQIRAYNPSWPTNQF